MSLLVSYACGRIAMFTGQVRNQAYFEFQFRSRGCCDLQDYVSSWKCEDLIGPNKTTQDLAAMLWLDTPTLVRVTNTFESRNVTHSLVILSGVRQYKRASVQ